LLPGFCRVPVALVGSLSCFLHGNITGRVDVQEVEGPCLQGCRLCAQREGMAAGWRASLQRKTWALPGSGVWTWTGRTRRSLFAFRNARATCARLLYASTAAAGPMASASRLVRTMPRTAATWPCGRARRMVTTASGDANVTPPARAGSIVP